MDSCRQRLRRTKKVSQKAGGDGPVPVQKGTQIRMMMIIKNHWQGQLAAVTH